MGGHLDAFQVSPLQCARNTAAIIVQNFPGSRFQVISVGDVGYMPASMLTGAAGDTDHSLAIPSLRMP